MKSQFGIYQPIWRTFYNFKGVNERHTIIPGNRYGLSGISILNQSRITILQVCRHPVHRLRDRRFRRCNWKG